MYRENALNELVIYRILFSEKKLHLVASTALVISSGVGKKFFFNVGGNVAAAAVDAAAIDVYTHTHTALVISSRVVEKKKFIAMYREML